jgi:hypothetical protein
MDARLSLSESRKLFLVCLLSHALDESESVRISTRSILSSLLEPQNPGSSDVQSELLAIARGSLTSLPHLIRLRAEAKVESLARQVHAICTLVADDKKSNSVRALLGPAGGIEKWGVTFLSVLELDMPAVLPGVSSFGPLLLSDSTPSTTLFPTISIPALSSPQTLSAIEDMLRALSKTAGEQGLYAIEWFIRIGQSGTTSSQAGALWCAARLIEGLADVELDSEKNPRKVNLPIAIERLSRSLARSIADLWDYRGGHDDHETPTNEPEELERLEVVSIAVEHVKGLKKLETKLDILNRTSEAHKMEHIKFGF